MQDPKDKESNAAAKHSSHSGTKVINSVSCFLHSGWRLSHTDDMQK